MRSQDSEDKSSVLEHLDVEAQRRLTVRRREGETKEGPKSATRFKAQGMRRLYNEGTPSKRESLT